MSSGVSSNSLMAFSGQLQSSRRRIAIYEYVLDEEQTKALNTAREIACQSGLVLEVTDLSQQDPIRRLLRIGMSKLTADAMARYKTAPIEKRGIGVTRSRAFLP